MDVTFHSAALAALCNSQRRLAERWGVDAGRAVGRRLLEIAAADSASLARLPRAKVSHNGLGETSIVFGHDLIVRGVISSNGHSGERILISSLEVKGSVQR